MVDDFNREALHIGVDTSITSQRLVRIFEQLQRDHGLPQVLRTDNGPEFLGEAFLVSYERDSEVTDIWFSYYKDLRSSGGRLKLGYGPGGPPVLGKTAILGLLSQLVHTRCLTPEEVVGAVSAPEP